MILTLKEIAELVGGSLYGDSSKSIHGIGALDSANSNQISYAVNEKYNLSDKFIFAYISFVVLFSGSKLLFPE